MLQTHDVPAEWRPPVKEVPVEKEHRVSNNATAFATVLLPSLATVAASHFIFGEKKTFMPFLYTAVPTLAVLYFSPLAAHFNSAAVGALMGIECRMIDKGPLKECGKYALFVGAAHYVSTQLIIPEAIKRRWLPA